LRIEINSVNKSFAGKTLEISGWVDALRDHGGVVFADLRNRSGKIQIVFDVTKKGADFAKNVSMLRVEFVIKVKGKVLERPKDSVNKKLATGEVELWVEEFEVLNTCEPLPFYPGEKVSEEVRLKYRFLDLRGAGMLKNLVSMDRIMKITRDYFSGCGFIEVVTPILTKSTPEGARDYLVPSRMQRGAFFALPQSPQLFKQILMAAGLEKYYQIAKCFRDEDLRADRQPEFLQIDMEMSFTARDEIMETSRALVEKIFEEFGIKLPAVVSLKYDESMKKFGSDKPDLRVEISTLEDITEVFRDSPFNVFRSEVQAGNKIVAFFAAREFSRGELDDLTLDAKALGAGGLVWIKKDGDDLKSPVLKLFGEKEINKIKELFNFASGMIFASTSKKAFEMMGALRMSIAKNFKLMKDGFYPVWVVDAPLFIKNEEGGLESVHHPFTAPVGDIFSENPLKMESLSYDFVINGEELGGGSVRIHQAEVQKKIFEILGIPEDEYNEKFGFLLKALSYGCPPHGGFAFGLERLAVKILGLDSIRDVIAFPKTQNAECPLSSAPAAVSPAQLRDLGIKIVGVRS